MMGELKRAFEHDLSVPGALPCPFCGCAETEGCNTNPSAWWIRCAGCGADAESGPGPVEGLANWNRRTVTAPDTSAEVERFSAEYVRFLAGLDGPTCQPTEDDERLSHEVGRVPVLAAEIVELRDRVLRLRREHNEALAEIDRLLALLPSPAAVRQARLVAAEIVAEWIGRLSLDADAGEESDHE